MVRARAGSRMARPRTARSLLKSALLLTIVAGGVAAVGPEAALANPDPTGTTYVVDDTTNTVYVFAPGANGNAVPVRTISGANTGLNVPADVKVDNAGDVYVSDFGNNSITEYAPGASGNATPIDTIAGSNTGLCENDDMSFTPDGTLYMGNFCGTPVEVFAPGASGNATPERTLTGSLGLTDGVGVDATGTLYAADTEGGDIQVYAPGASGTAAPIRTISGSNTGLTEPDDVVVGFNGQLFVTDGNGSVEVFAPGASGNATPVQSISGSNTGLSDPDDMAVSTNGTIYVTNSGGGNVLEFAPGATGNVAPIVTLGGSNIGFIQPEGVAVAEPTSTLGLSTTAASPTVALGSATSDTATLSGGTSPTGSLVFKLFGPNDATCNNAPAFTSSAATVTGAGAYNSPTFIPTASGTYTWVAAYSGDQNNPPLTETCGAASETVTVSPSTGIGPPTVTINEPANGTHFRKHQVVHSRYSCADATGGPGIQSCVGPVPSGSVIDTSTSGPHTFSVTATSKDGQTTTQFTTYTVNK